MNKSPFSYLEDLIAANQSLAGVEKFCFYPGMLFCSQEKWWPDVGMRPTSHEGIDICYYTDGRNIEQKLSPQTVVPAISSGVIYGFCRDFLGQSVFVDHGIVAAQRFLSVYAHIAPCPHLGEGHEVQGGSVLGKIADTAGRKNRMPAHIHLSLLAMPSDVSSDMLHWDYICQSSKVRLIDPLSMIKKKMVKVLSENPWKDKDTNAS